MLLGRPASAASSPSAARRLGLEHERQQLRGAVDRLRPRRLPVETLVPRQIYYGPSARVVKDRGAVMFVNDDAPLRDPQRGGDGRPRPRLAPDRLRARRRVHAARGRRVLPRGRPEGRGRTRSSSTPSSCSSRSPRRRASSTCRRATRSKTVHIGGDHMVFSGVYGPPFVREGDIAARREDGRLRELREALAVVPRARLARRHDRASPRTARSTRATSTWSTRCRRCPTSRTWAR